MTLRQNRSYGTSNQRKYLQLCSSICDSFYIIAVSCKDCLNASLSLACKQRANAIVGQFKLLQKSSGANIYLIRERY